MIVTYVPATDVVVVVVLMNLLAKDWVLSPPPRTMGAKRLFERTENLQLIESNVVR